jgi:hypothetical protein
VHDLVPEEVVLEQRGKRVHVDCLSGAEREPGRVVHPAVDGNHHHGARESGDHDRNPGEEVRARR